MKLDKQLLRSFAEATRRSYALDGLGLNEGILLEALEIEISDDFGELSREEVRDERWRWCGIEGTRPVDFSEWLLEIDGERSVICGIRHLGRNLSKPFVQLVPNFQFESAAEVKAFYREHLAKRFECFAPKWVQVYLPTNEDSEAGGSLFLVARASSMMANGNGIAAEAISLVDVEDDGYFEWYEKIYDSYLQEFPALKDWVHRNDLDLMQACRSEGLVKLVMIHGERAGLVAADQQSFLGHAGIYFVELLLTRKWRGKGLAKTVQQAFVRTCCQPRDIVWGQIDRKNVSSLRTAKANGRRIVRGECFLSV